jgi:RimJ/RimL family protein N-acetyltransferase
MKPVFLEGERLDLCVLDPVLDLEYYEHWVNDQETTAFLAIGKYPTTRTQLAEFIKKYNSSKDLLLGIFLKDGNSHIGNITLHSIDWLNRTGEVGILIGDKQHRGHGYGQEAVRLVIAHAFDKMNLRKITSGMYSGNTASQKMFEKIGFKLEGRLREHFFSEGVYYDALRYGLLRSEWARA